MRTVAFLLLFGLSGNLLAAGLSKQEKRANTAIETTVRNAGKSFSAGKFEEAGEAIRQAMKQIDLAMKDGSSALFDALQPSMKRVARAHTLLEFEGITLPPFHQPNRPKTDRSERSMKPETGLPKTRKPKRSPAKPPPSAEISFTKTVAPILVDRCGRCHVAQSKGKFSMATYAALMTGAPEGVVIFAGDTVGSRLVETIESGDMPRGGGKVTSDEFATLKKWIQTGATFDGEDIDAPIDGRSMPTPAPDNSTPVVRKATGNETVSFSKDIAPLLIENCKGCHLDATRTRGGLRLDTFVQLLRGGDSGAIIQPGKSEASLLIKKLKGTEGERMPAGGRPPLSDQSVTLIAKWIDEGAVLDGASETQPLTVMSQLAWAASATAKEISERRQSIIERNLSLVVGADKEFKSKPTENFFVVGPVAQETIDLVAQLAEQQMKTAAIVVSPRDGSTFRGRATIVVLPKRYDYSEFAKMIEQRSLPADWSSHWNFDGIDAYVAMVASDVDDEKAIIPRLAAPIVSLAVATRGSDVPYWLAQGIGSAVTKEKTNRRDREGARKAELELSTALSAMKNAKQFLDGKLTPRQTDKIGEAIATSMLEGNGRRNFDQMMRQLTDGKPFEQAIVSAYRMTTEQLIEAWRP